MKGMCRFEQVIFKQTLRRLNRTTLLTLAVARSSSHHHGSPDVLIPEYVWAAMTTARGTSYC